MGEDGSAGDSRGPSKPEDEQADDDGDNTETRRREGLTPGLSPSVRKSFSIHVPDDLTKKMKLPPELSGEEFRAGIGPEFGLNHPDFELPISFHERFK